MTNILTVINQKGGVGKTSLVYNLGYELFKRKYKVLFIDTDPQKNLTYTLTDGYFEDMDNSFFDIMQETVNINDCIIKGEKFDYIPSSSELSGIDRNQKNMFALDEAIKQIKENYDFILIDNPPNLCSITINAIVSSTVVIVPTEASIYAMNGIRELDKTLNTIRQATSKEIVIDGVLINRYKKQTYINNELSKVLLQASEQFKTRIYKTMIRDSIAMVEATANNSSVIEFAPSSKIATDYKNFVDELLKSKNLKIKG